MSLNDPLANVLSHITNVEKLGKPTLKLHDNNKTIMQVLKIMKENQYLGETKQDENKNLTVNLIGKINKANVIKPRYSVKIEDYDKFEKQYLPAKDFGIIFVSTSQGIMTHTEAKQKNLGGRLLAYCY